MTHTVVGLFETKDAARDAMQELTNAGFVKESVDLSNRSQVVADVPSTTDGDGDVLDSISNFFGSLFGEEGAEYDNYMTAAQEANAILTVMADSNERAEKAAEILDNHGAIDVEEKANEYRQTHARTEGSDEVNIPIVEENIEVGKKTVETGGVRVRSRVIEKPVEETVRLREEHVVINRNPVNRAATEADIDNFQEGDIEITEKAEKAVVGKSARVVEEVSIGKTVEEQDKTVSDSVRRTEVEVEEVATDVEVDTDVDRKHHS